MNQARLSTFAFVHAIEPAQLAWFRAAMPGVEFLVPGSGALPEGLERAEAASISWNGPPIDSVLAAARSLRWLHQRGAGIDANATPTLVASDIVLTNGSGNHAINIAEHVLGMMLAFARQLPALVLAQRERRWQPPPVGSLFELSGADAGGGWHRRARRSGSPSARRRWGMTVLGVRRTVAADAALPPGVSRLFVTADLDAALRDADHVVITLPLTAQTRGLFSAARLASMKAGARLYNVGRGCDCRSRCLARGAALRPPRRRRPRRDRPGALARRVAPVAGAERARHTRTPRA